MAEFRKTKDREEAYRNMMNVWLQNSPQNQAVLQAIIIQNKERGKNLSSVYGASTEHPKDLRIGVSLPPGLYYCLLNLERQHGNTFLETKKDLWWFARKFPQFCIMERI
jgi:hypothetical protein